MSESSTPTISFSDNTEGELDLSDLLNNLSLTAVSNNSDTNASSESTESQFKENNFSNSNNNLINNSPVRENYPSTSKLNNNNCSIATIDNSNSIDINNSIIMTSAQKFDLKNLNIISPFDGNPCELYNFLKVSQTFLTIYFNEEDPGCVQNLLLFEGIKSRLEGRAREVISIYGANTWDEIKSVLTQNFGDQRDENSLNRDLVNLRQTNETPQQFYEKIMSILNIICNYIEIHNVDNNIKISKKNFFTQQALVTFLAGLKEPLGSTIRAMRPKCLATAMQFIVEENNIRYLQKTHISNNQSVNQSAIKKHIFQHKPQQNYFQTNNTPRFAQPNFQSQFNNFQSPKFPTGPINVHARTNHPQQKFFTNQQTFKKSQNVWKPGQNNQQQTKSTPMSVSTRNTFRKPQNQFRDFRDQPGPSSRPNFASEELFNVEYESTQDPQNDGHEYEEYVEYDETQEYQEDDEGNFLIVPDTNPET